MKYCVTIQRYQRIFMIQKVLSIPMNLSALSIKQCSSHDCTPINQCSYRSISGTDTSEITPKMLVPVQRLDRYGHWLTGGGLQKNPSEMPDSKHITKRVSADPLIFQGVCGFVACN